MRENPAAMSEAEREAAVARSVKFAGGVRVLLGEPPKMPTADIVEESGVDCRTWKSVRRNERSNLELFGGEGVTRRISSGI